METSDEQHLLTRAQNGDYLAFEALHDLLYPAIWRFVRRLVGDDDDSDDIVQLTFMALYRNLHRVDPAETLRPYVYKIARNRSYDVLRQQGRYDIEPLDDDVAQVRVTFSSEAPQPEDAVHWLLVRLEVMEAVDKLPELQRQTLILFAEEGLSLQEIGLAMDVSVGTVKSRLYHARQTLRRLLPQATLNAVGELLGSD